MKRGIIALVLIAAIIAMSFLASKAVTAKADEIETAAQAACESKESTKALKAVWAKNKKFISLFVGHTHLEPIDLRLSSVELMTPDEIKESCAEIAAYAEEIRELMKPSVYNIF